MVVMGGGSYLGVGVREIDEERARTLKLNETYGVEITRIDEESPASKAGLKAGDVVLEYNGARVEGIEQFVRLVRETPANRSVKLSVFRGGSMQTLTATVGARKGPKVMAWSAMPDAPEIKMDKFKVEVPPMEMVMPDIPKAMMSWRSTMLGIEGEPLSNSQLADYFGVKEGVLVRSVIKGTSAEKAGIKAGDVLLKIDDTTLTAPRDITTTIRSARSASRKTLNVVLMRDKREMSLPVTLEDEPEKLPTRGQRVTMQRF
jgi:serine protease Do